MSGWVKCSERMPEKDQVVFWYDATITKDMWIGTYIDADVYGDLRPMPSKHCPNYCNTKWKWEDVCWNKISPTHWHPFPDIPPRHTEAELDTLVEMVRRG